MPKHYFCYHKHTDYSLLDSCTNYKDYILMAVTTASKRSPAVGAGLVPVLSVPMKTLTVEPLCRPVRAAFCWTSASLV